MSSVQYVVNISDVAGGIIPYRGSQMSAEGIVEASAFIYKYVETHGMTKLLDNFGSLLLPASHIVASLKDKYPNEATKIKLWQKLHGV